MTTLWHAYTWLWFMLGVWAIYGFCRETGLSRPVSCAGALLLYLCPRFFAEGHYNNKDMVLLSLVLCTLWLGVRLLASPGFLRGLLFSLAGAMAANTKIAGAFAWGVMGLCAVVMLTARARVEPSHGSRRPDNHPELSRLLRAFNPRALERALLNTSVTYCKTPPALRAGPAWWYFAA